MNKEELLSKLNDVGYTMMKQDELTVVYQYIFDNDDFMEIEIHDTYYVIEQFTKVGPSAYNSYTLAVIDFKE